VAFQNLAAARTETRALLLQTGLNGAVIAQILPAEARGIARAGILLLRRARMLSESKWDTSDQKRCGKGKPFHHTISPNKELRRKRAACAKSSSP
jgi:hypothetical protein